MLNSRSNVDMEREFRFPHSKQVWKGVPVIAANMDTTGTFEIGDVLKKYKKVLAEKKSTEAIVKSIAEGLVVVDSQGKVIMLNPAAEKLLGSFDKTRVYLLCFHVSSVTLHINLSQLTRGLNLLFCLPYSHLSVCR